MTALKYSTIFARECKFRFYLNSTQVMADAEYVLVINSSSALVAHLIVRKPKDGVYRASIDYINGSAIFQEDFYYSTIRSMIANISLINEGSAYKFSIDDQGIFPVTTLQSFGFVKNGKKFDLFIQDTSALVQAKKTFYSKAKPENAVGRGFVIDTSSMRPQVDLLNEEYNQIAWGVSAWANHQELAEDEMEIINRFVFGRVCEIGAGTGRVSAKLIEKSSHSTITDYVPELVEQLGKIFSDRSKVTVKLEDIVKDKVNPNEYDCVCFFENGIGNIGTVSDRKKAISNMVARTKAAGRTILSFRVMEPVSGDHVMIASMDPCFMGVYHTFSRKEIEQLFEGLEGKLTLIDGVSRPAGGFAVFAIFEKE